MFFNLDFFLNKILNLHVVPFISLNKFYNIVQLVKKIKHISTSLRHRIDKQGMKKIRRKTGHRHGDEDPQKHMPRDGVDFASQGISTHSRSCGMGLKTKIKIHLSLSI